MRCLTVCQPFASLIMLPATDPRHKRVENRNWFTNYRGPLLIHAGKSREWLDCFNHEGLDVPFGAILGMVTLVGCIRPGERWAELKWPWLKTHAHAEGPWMWVVLHPRPFAQPIPYRGELGLFDVPAEAIPANLLRPVA